MNPRRSRAETGRRLLRWTSAAALFALAPKCLACLAAYAGLGAALGAKLAGPELCGASAATLPATSAGLTLLGSTASLALLLRFARIKPGARCPSSRTHV